VLPDEIAQLEQIAAAADSAGIACVGGDEVAVGAKDRVAQRQVTRPMSNGELHFCASRNLPAVAQRQPHGRADRFGETKAAPLPNSKLSKISNLDWFYRGRLGREETAVWQVDTPKNFCPGKAVFRH
jgi:hypothetical protein